MATAHTPICSFWERGRCSKGQSCRFQHGYGGVHDAPAAVGAATARSAGSPSAQAAAGDGRGRVGSGGMRPPASILVPCRYFREGEPRSCEKGELCAFLHQHSGGGGDERRRRGARSSATTAAPPPAPAPAPAVVAAAATRPGGAVGRAASASPLSPDDTLSLLSHASDLVSRLSRGDDRQGGARAAAPVATSPPPRVVSPSVRMVGRNGGRVAGERVEDDEEEEQEQERGRKREEGEGEEEEEEEDVIAWVLPGEGQGYFYAGQRATSAERLLAEEAEAVEESSYRAAVARSIEDERERRRRHRRERGASSGDSDDDNSSDRGETGGKAAAEPAEAVVVARRPCLFFQKGNCRYGAFCRNSHDAVQRWELDEGADDRTEEEKLRLDEEEKKVSEESTCGICYEKVDGLYGLLTSCVHVFCLQCIREWRSQGLEQQHASSVRQCPICRTTSYFIVPSGRVVKDAIRKENLINKYKESLSHIPCKLFVYGERECPFGASCFYAHLMPDGKTRVPAPKPRIMVGGDMELEAILDIHLNTFL